GVHRALVQAAGPLRAEMLQQRGLAQRKAAEDETAIAAGGAVAHFVGLEQDDIAMAALGQAQGGVQAGEAAADDDRPGFTPARQRRVTGACRRRRPIVGGAGVHGPQPEAPAPTSPPCGRSGCCSCVPPGTYSGTASRSSENRASSLPGVASSVSM